jgi:2-polyprenyl-3-methyl-5-hydroxy-6-metoxy-1,4-benzoquinol methylase
MGAGSLVMGSLAGVADAELGARYRGQSRPEVMKLLSPLKQGLRVLEVGCGEGAFSAQIPDTNETWGIEPDVRSARIAEGRLNRVLTGVFEETKNQLPIGYFDLIVCNDVVEHMTDHDAFLRTIKNYMAPGCRLVGSVPNVRYYKNLFNLVVLRDWHYQDAGILDRTHFRFFTFRSVRRGLSEAGFEVKKLEGLNKELQSGWNCRVLAERLFQILLSLISVGTAQDIKFIQIGFVAVRHH